MDELQISGKRFISARRIARENGYTSDYIGQLIRGGKIVGQKVGRAWYVDAASFDRYLGSESPETSVEPESTQEHIAAVPVVAEIEAAPEPAPLLESEADAEEVKKTVDTPVEVSIEVEEENAPEEVTTPAPAETEPSIQEEEEETIEQSPIIESLEEEKRITEVPVRVPLRIKKEEPIARLANNAGLRYYSDDAPAIPEIAKQRNESRMDAEEEIAPAEAVEHVRVARISRSNRMHVASVVIAGVMVFAFAALVSSAVSLNLSIQEGNAAAASYGFQW